MSRDLIIKWLLETVNMVWNLKYLWILFRKMCCIKLKVKITKLKLVGDDQKNIKLYMTFLVKNQSNDIQHVPDWISSKIVSQSKKNPIVSFKKKKTENDCIKIPRMIRKSKFTSPLCVSKFSLQNKLMQAGTMTAL